MMVHGGTDEAIPHGSDLPPGPGPVVWERLLESFSTYEPGEAPYPVLRAAVAAHLDASPVPIDPTDRSALLAEAEDVGRPSGWPALPSV